MKTIELNESVTTVQELVEQAAHEAILLRDVRGGSYILAPVDEGERETLVLADHPQLRQILDRSRARAEREGWLTTEELRSQLGIGP